MCRSRHVLAACLCLVTLVATACSRGSAASGGDVVTVDGSSTVFPISEAVAEEFQMAQPGSRVTVGISGTGGGFQKFCRGETDISNASRPISATEQAACAAAGIRFIELPVAYDGIAIVVHPSATWIDSITTAELRTIWATEAQGRVMRWSQVRAGWPDRELHLFGAGVDSGTYDYFTQAITGTEGASRGDFTSSEDDNVLVQGISSDESALGFMPFAYYAENPTAMKLVAVDDGRPDNGAGAIRPSVDTVKQGTYQPLARPVFVYVSLAALQRPAVARFMDFYIAEGGALAQDVGYVPLGERGYALVAEHFRRRTTGSVFEAGVSSVGLSIDDLLARER